MESRLYDRASDIALLRELAHANRHWQGPSLVRCAIAWLGWSSRTSATGGIAIGMHRTLGALYERGYVERRNVTGGGAEWRLAPNVNLKLLTGGIDPRKISVEECLELDSPSVQGLRRVEFDPQAFMRMPGTRGKVAHALWQCPSPWELGRRMKQIDDRKHTTHSARKDEDELEQRRA